MELMYNEYKKLTIAMDDLHSKGMNSLDPVMRSIGRRLEKLYKCMTEQERLWADGFIAFRSIDL